MQDSIRDAVRDQLPVTILGDFCIVGLVLRKAHSTSTQGISGFRAVIRSRRRMIPLAASPVLLTTAPGYASRVRDCWRARQRTALDSVPCCRSRYSGYLPRLRQRPVDYPWRPDRSPLQNDDPPESLRCADRRASIRRECVSLHRGGTLSLWNGVKRPLVPPLSLSPCPGSIITVVKPPFGAPRRETLGPLAQPTNNAGNAVTANNAATLGQLTPTMPTMKSRGV